MNYIKFGKCATSIVQIGGGMKLYSGKAKDLTFKQLLWIVYFDLSNPLEKLEPEDFSTN